MRFQVGEQTVGALHGMIEVVIHCRIIHQQSQTAFLALHLGHHTVDIAYGAVDTVHSGLQVQTVDILASLVESAGHGRYILSQEAFELHAALIQIGCQSLGILQYERQIGIGSKGIECGQEGIHTCQHLIHLGHEVCGL